MTQSKTTAVARYGENMVMKRDGGIAFGTVADVIDYATLLADAGMLPKGMTPKGAAVSIIAGASLGMNPFASVQNICAVNGRPTVWGDMMIALVKASGLVEDEKVEYVPNPKPSECKGVRYTVKRKGIPTAYVGTFSINDAKTAGLWGKPGPWTTSPLRMMLNRARAFALRDGFADILKGIRSAEEEHDILTMEANGNGVAHTAPAPAQVKKVEAEVSPSPFDDVESVAEDAINGESIETESEAENVSVF